MTTQSCTRCNTYLTKLDQTTDYLHESVTELRQSRTALENAQATIALLLEQTQRLIEIARRADAEPRLVDDIEDLVLSIDDTAWLSELRTEAFSRGFEEGWIYAKTNTTTLPSNAKERFSLYQSKAVSIWDPKPRFSSIRFNKTKNKKFISRFSLSETGTLEEVDDLESSACNQFVKFDDYVNLQFLFDTVKEELSGYQWLLRTRDHQTHSEANKRQDPCKNFIRVRPKAGSVRMQYGKNRGENSLFVIYGEGVPRCDRILFMNFLTGKQMRFDYTSQRPQFEPSLEDELMARGYDLSTLKFTISKKHNL